MVCRRVWVVGQLKDQKSPGRISSVNHSLFKVGMTCASHAYAYHWNLCQVVGYYNFGHGACHAHKLTVNFWGNQHLLQLHGVRFCTKLYVLKLYVLQVLSRQHVARHMLPGTCCPAHVAWCKRGFTRTNIEKRTAHHCERRRSIQLRSLEL